MGARGEPAREEVAGPDDAKPGIEDEKAGVGVVDDGRELLALALEDPDLALEQARPALPLNGHYAPGRAA
jgi:hypothetical protein